MAVRAIGTPSQPYTVADLEDTPDDGRWYELSYGVLIVTPAPNLRHQTVMPKVAAVLLSQVPPGKRVLGEAELQIRADVVKRPDVMVVDESRASGQRVMGTADLVVEVHSPSTRVLDMTEKRTVYAAAGIPAYWLVDPDAETVTVLELRQG